MKIISFDVGIKNLACCVLDVCQENSHESKILYWDVLNLTNPTIYPTTNTTIPTATPSTSKFIIYYYYFI